MDWPLLVSIQSLALHLDVFPLLLNLTCIKIIYGRNHLGNGLYNILQNMYKNIPKVREYLNLGHNQTGQEEVIWWFIKIVD